MRYGREWAMPNKNTFQVAPIGAFVKRYLENSETSIDPFARNNTWATYTNDLNPETTAQHHMRASDYLAMLVGDGIQADLIIFDPPYSIRQAKEVYEKYGEFKFSDTQQVGRWTEEKALCNQLIKPGGVFLHFGWSTNGMGKKYNFEPIELLVVAHGGAHHDTLCLAEKKVAHQEMMFEANP